jgi:hypothetical protein
LFRKPVTHVHWRNSTNESEGKPEKKFDAAYSEQSLELVGVFKEASRNFTFIFLFNKPG